MGIIEDWDDYFSRYRRIPAMLTWVYAYSGLYKNRFNLRVGELEREFFRRLRASDFDGRMAILGDPEINWEEVAEIFGIDMRDPRIFRRVSHDQVQNECAICIEDILEDEDFGALQCGHIFHFLCIADWVISKQSRRCPYCNGPIV